MRTERPSTTSSIRTMSVPAATSTRPCGRSARARPSRGSTSSRPCRRRPGCSELSLPHSYFIGYNLCRVALLSTSPPPCCCVQTVQNKLEQFKTLPSVFIEDSVCCYNAFCFVFSCFFCECEIISIEASGLQDCPLQATFVWHHPGCCVMVLCQWLDSRRSVPYCVFGTASIPPFSSAL